MVAQLGIEECWKIMYMWISPSPDEIINSCCTYVHGLYSAGENDRKYQIYVCVFAYVCIRMYICVLVYIYIHIYMYIRTVYARERH